MSIYCELPGIIFGRISKCIVFYIFLNERNKQTGKWRCVFKGFDSDSQSAVTGNRKMLYDRGFCYTI